MFTLLDLLEKTDNKYIKSQNVSLWSFVVSSQTEIWREMDTKLKTHLTGLHTEFNFIFYGSVLESYVGVNPIFKIYKPDVLVYVFMQNHRNLAISKILI